MRQNSPITSLPKKVKQWRKKQDLHGFPSVYITSRNQIHGGDPALAYHQWSSILYLSAAYKSYPDLTTKWHLVQVMVIMCTLKAIQQFRSYIKKKRKQVCSVVTKRAIQYSGQ